MVDVVLVILIFFMASIVFVGPEWFLPAAIPADQPAQAAEDDDPYALPDPTLHVRITVIDDGPFVSGLGADVVSLDSFEAYAAEQLGGVDPASVNVRLGADGGVVWQHVVNVQDVLTRLGIRRIALDAATP